MIAAIYARKSTEQNGVADEDKSVSRQIEHAKAYAAKKGWVVDHNQIYQDDGISGAEFVKRPGFLRLMNVLKPRPPFQVLIMSEESRLGREQIETAYALKQIIDAGVRVFFHLEDRERTLDSAMDKVMLSLTNFAAEMEREKARQRTYDAMLRKAKALQVTGGKVYGYGNVEVLAEQPGPDGRRKRLHVVRKINPGQATVVRRIFGMYAAGAGMKKIAKALNAEHVAPPRQDTRGWAPTAVREILHRELYRGVIVWNRSQKTMRGGTKKQRRRPKDEWLRLEAPELRIVSDDFWSAVQARLTKAAELFPRRRDGGQLFGRPSYGDADSPYLLTGFAACSICEGSVGGLTRLHGTGPASGRKRVQFYSCTRRRNRGPHVCTNDVVLPAGAVDQILLDALRDVLDDRVTEAAVDKALERLRTGQEGHLDRRTQIERELSLIESRLGRLMEALVSGGPLETLVGQVKTEEERKKALANELQGLAKAERVATVDTQQIKADLRERVADVKALLGRHTPQARQMLRKLVEGKIAVEPVTQNGRRGFRLSGRLNVGRLLKGEVYEAIEAGAADTDNSLTVVAPTGFEPVFQP
jgi:site-specific DNA recombinase